MPLPSHPCCSAGVHCRCLVVSCPPLWGGPPRARPPHQVFLFSSTRAVSSPPPLSPFTLPPPSFTPFAGRINGRRSRNFLFSRRLPGRQPPVDTPLSPASPSCFSPHHQSPDQPRRATAEVGHPGCLRGCVSFLPAVGPPPTPFPFPLSVRAAAPDVRTRPSLRRFASTPPHRPLPTFLRQLPRCLGAGQAGYI